ncbi:MAG TPA: glutathione S-transferase family protein [Myxococcaceae bacterium]|jgi:glutathione S-transferase
MKLYYWAGTRAVRPRWLLEELAVPYELVRLDPGKEQSKDYLRIHPHGQVPALVDGEATVHESCAICLYAADKFIERGLAPMHGTARRAEYYKWMVYAVAPTDPPLYAVWRSRQAGGEAATINLKDALESVSRWSGVLEGVLSERPFFLGESFSAVDVMLGSGVIWARSLEMLQDRPRLNAYAERLMERPAYKRAHQD